MHIKSTKLVGTLLLAGVSVFAASAANATVVTYNDFSSTAGLTMVGSAAATTTADGQVLRLTSSGPGQSGAAYSTTAVTLGSSATFSTNFQFRLSNPGGIDPADGITFVLSAGSSGLGGAGGGLGYYGVPNSVAIEFDTYNNGSGDSYSDNQVGVDVSGNINSIVASNAYGVSSCGFSAATGCLSNGDLWTANIVYDGTKLSIKIFDPTEGTTFNVLTDYAIDIASILGTNNAYVGFTAATGSGYENQDIINWSFANTTELATIPEPYSLALAGAGLLALGAMRRRK